jgi:hypothetical protein
MNQVVDSFFSTYLKDYGHGDTTWCVILIIPLIYDFHVTFRIVVTPGEFDKV